MTTKIPFLDLAAQYAPIQDEIDAAVRSVFASRQFILGGAVEGFERDFAAYCGTRSALGVNSGTSALHLILLALGIGPGDEVIVPAMTFIATAAAVSYTGARPVFVDVDPVYYTMDPAAAEAAITPRTRALMPVHLYGQPADMDALAAVAERHGLALVEDAAQAHGAQYKGRRIGSIGIAAGFSFYPGKNLGAAGEGGAVVSSDPAIIAKVKCLRDWGQTERYKHQYLGFNYRMDGLQGAILGVKLMHLEAWTDGRVAAAGRYRSLLLGADVTCPQVRPECRHVSHVFAILSARRDALKAQLDKAGVGCGLHYPVPVHLQPCYESLGCKAGQFPVAERIAREELSLPMFAELTPEQQETVAEALCDAV